MEYLSPSGAFFTDDRRHRLYLWRRWSDGPAIMFVGLNPSTADEAEDDPTIRRCLGFAKRWGYGTMYMCNAFSLVSTDPSALKGLLMPDLVERTHDLTLRIIRTKCQRVVLAWGNGIDFVCVGPRRSTKLIEMLSPVYSFGSTQRGRPKHPLYLKRDATLTRLG